MTLSGPLRKVASKVIAKFGGEITIRRITAGVYNPTTGTASETNTDTAVAWCARGCQRSRGK
jgi:hypothetical protein